MTLDDIQPDENGDCEPLEVHEGVDGLPRRNFNIDHELVMKTTAVVDKKKAKFPTDEMLDTAVEGIQSKWKDEVFSYHWVDREELWAWHEDREVKQFKRDHRAVLIICKWNSKYCIDTEVSPSEWLRVITEQGDLGTARRLIMKAHKSLNDIGLGVYGVSIDDFRAINFSFLKAIPQDKVSIWEQFLMERDEWLEQESWK